MGASSSMMHLVGPCIINRNDVHSHYLAKCESTRLPKFATKCMYMNYEQHLKTVTVLQLQLLQSCLLRWTAPKMSGRRACVAPAQTASLL